MESRAPLLLFLPLQLVFRCLCACLARMTAAAAYAVASRVLSVGDAARGKRIAAFLDGGKSFEHKSSRGFVVHTGLYNRVRASASPDVAILP